MPNRLEACRLVQLHNVQEPNGLLVVNSQMAQPFLVKRVFTLIAPAGAMRGQHAHRECSQFLVVPTGKVEVAVTDGDRIQEYCLDTPTVGLLVPPLVWASELFVSVTSSLLVLCDQEYDESDYIRDWDEYLAYMKLNIRSGSI